MCGIAAIARLGTASTRPGMLEDLVRRVAHRGPDGDGHVWLSAAQQVREVATDAPWQVALGHRRLSIIDLSDAARQPMRRADLWLTYNGELYNHVELRAELESLGSTFATHSDTEVLLAAYERWGTDAFRRCKGMWGLVLVDARRREVVACRDRLGIKPLYLFEHGGSRYFVSEIKQLLGLGAALTADDAALRSYLATGYEDSSRSFFRGVRPIPAGTWVSWSLDDGRQIATDSYWHPEAVEPQCDDPDEAGRRFAAALTTATREHLRSDVPVGCALSGGLDSTSIAALVRELEPSARLNTFTATFPGDSIDERSWVDTALKAVRAEAHFVTPTADRFDTEIDAFVLAHDEPVGSLSQYAGWCVARTTREAGVPVTLNGQGGDEVLGGYWQSYFTFLRSAARRGSALTLLRHFSGTLVGGNPELLRQVPVMVRRYRSRRAASGPSAAASVLDRVLSMNDRERRVFEIREMYLPRLLKWDDRNFMAFSVEGRYPFLDHQLIELALSFTPRALYHRGWVKEPLRRGLQGRVPLEILRRRTKLGFETPQARWLGGALRPAIERFVANPSPLWGTVPQSSVQQLAREALDTAQPSEESGQALFRHWCADRWLRVFFDGANLARAA